MTTSEHDRFLKTGLLRDLEARVRSGEKPTHYDVARIVRRALEETPFEDLPLNKALIDYILSLPVRPSTRRLGRPPQSVAKRREQIGRALRLVAEVEAERRRLKAAGEGVAWETAVDKVALLHNMTSGNLRKLMKRAPEVGKSAAKVSLVAPRQFDCGVDGWPLNPNHPWNATRLP